MVFLNPWLFWGLAATVAVPIVLHLIMRQTPKHVIFPALQFLRQRNEANRRRLRFRHLLLLALRTAALLFLAAALCRPNIGCSGIRKSKEGPVSAAVIIDTSPGMLYQQQNRTRLKEAQDTADWLLTKLPSDSQVAVLGSASDEAAFAVDLAHARETLRQLKPVTTPDRLLDVAARAVEKLKSGKHEAKELYLFTDLSRREWSPEFAGRLNDRLAALKDLGVYVIDVGARSPRNTALGELRLSGEVVARNTAVQLQQLITRTGGEFNSELQVLLNDPDGKPIPQQPAGVSLAPGDSQTVPIRLSGLAEPGTYQGEIRVVNSNGNQLEIDDRRYFTIEVQHAWPLLLVAPDPVKAYTWDFRQFLEPARHRSENRQRFTCTEMSLQELDSPTLKLDQYRAVCLLDPGPLPPPVWDKLAAYTRGGGGVAIFLGKNAEKSVSFNDPSAQAILAGPLRRPVFWRQSTYLDLKPEQHAMLRYFGQLDEPLPWRAFGISRAWEVAPVEGVKEVIAFTNGSPALFERPVGAGRVLTMTTPVSDDPRDPDAWCSLPWLVTEQNGSLIPPRPFMALANEMMRYLVGAYDQRLNGIAGEGARIVLDAEKPIDRYLLRPPSGDGSAHDAEPSERVISITATGEVGNYRVEAKEKGLNRGFSSNLLPHESILTRVSESDLKGIFGETPFSLARNRDEINRKLTETRVGHELFPLLIALVAMILGAEHVLANRFYRHQEEDTEAEAEPTRELAANERK